MVRQFRGQSYSKLHSEATKTGQLFTDPTFPPTKESLISRHATPSGTDTGHEEIVWKRPSEICDNPKLVVNGVSTTDLNQGVLGNCWFVAACSCLASEPKLWGKVIPNWRQQEWDETNPERYGGIFHFHFWRLGEWVDVVIDDYLPTRNGELVYMKSQDRNEFWSPLLEKAYAKLAGSYHALAGGQTGDALVDFTGGVNEAINMRKEGHENDEEKKIELFEKMMEAHRHRAMISCSISLSEGDTPEKELDCGLIKGHAYAITDIRMISMSSGLLSVLGRRSPNLMMLKLRNPWGRKEWNGAWSDQSEEWQKIPAKEREKMDLKIDDDGDFWMELHDWIHWFTDVSLCRQVNTSLLSLEKTWHEANFHGEWKGQSAGGSVNNRETFLRNPQYLFKVPQGEAEVMLSLMQEDARSGLSSVGGKNFPIGFYIMKVEENRAYRLHVIQEKVGTITFTDRRSVFGMFHLKPGTYVVVPSTFEPNKERSFLLRVFSERALHAKELKNEIPGRGCVGIFCFCCWQRPRSLVTVHLENAHDLKKQDITGAGADPYCIVRCGGQKAQTPVIKNTLNPTFGSKVNFYISNPASTDVTVQVWNHNLMVDTFLGQMVVPIPGDGDSRRSTERLMGRGRSSATPTQGTLSIRVECSTNLLSS